MSEKANFRALLPMIVFLVLFIGTGIALTATGADMPFYQLSATVAIIPAIVLAILQGKDDLNKKIGVFLSGVGEINIITMCMIFLLAGGFASVASAIGGVKATVNFGLSLLPPSMILPGLFLIGAFISHGDGHQHGDRGRHCAHCGGRGRTDRHPAGLASRRGHERGHVRGQPVHDIRHNHSCGKDTGLRDEG